MSLAQVNLLGTAVDRRAAAEDLRSLRALSAVVASAFSRDGAGREAVRELADELMDQLSG